MALRLCFRDTDGDALEFRLTAQGKLQEFQGGHLEIAEVRALGYSASEAQVTDAGGDFNFRPGEQADKAMALRALAACAGVAWHGDEPRAPERVCFTDTDGDLLEFRLSAEGRLQEFVNGELEAGDVRCLTFSLRDGRILDEDGVFHIGPQERLEKSVLLRVLVHRAGAEWHGDEPVPFGKAAVASWLHRFAGPDVPGDSHHACPEEPEVSDDESWELLSRCSARSRGSGGWEVLSRRSSSGKSSGSWELADAEQPEVLAAAF